MMRLALLGHPVKHSLSPLIHGYWCAQNNVAGTYDLVDVAPDRLATAVAMMRGDGYTGFNVTVPHKRAIMAHGDDFSPAARALGAVNTVTIRNGRLYGANTDAMGFIAGLMPVDPDLRFRRGRVVVLGAGGAARAIVWILKRVGTTDVVIAARDAAKAAALAAENGVRSCAWAQAGGELAGARLLVNATSGGMLGADALDFDMAALGAPTLVCDIVYRPRLTPLLAAAAERGCPTVDGLGMLLQQAALAFRQWTGIRPQITPELRTMIRRAAEGKNEGINA